MDQRTPIQCISIGTGILSFLGGEARLDFVPDAFPNGTPKNPSRLYIAVTLPEPPGETDAVYLRALGWISEDYGYAWLYYA